MANGHGGARPGAGRRPGATTKAKMDMISLAREHAREAFGILIGIARSEKAPADARKGAAIAILDRAFGRPAQAIGVVPVEQPAEFEETLDLSNLTDEELKAYQLIADKVQPTEDDDGTDNDE